MQDFISQLISNELSEPGLHDEVFLVFLFFFYFQQLFAELLLKEQGYHRWAEIVLLFLLTFLTVAD